MLHRTIVLMALLATPSLAAAEFTLRSADIAADSRITAGHVYRGYGCKGGNRSPALMWDEAPAGTRSFALTVFDPDAPGSGWWHWLVVNIPAQTRALAAGAGDASGKSLPAGALHVQTDFGSLGYGGPCPPAGDKPHRYVFTLYALKTARLELPADATAAQASAMIDANQIGTASFTATYGR